MEEDLNNVKIIRYIKCTGSEWTLHRPSASPAAKVSSPVLNQVSITMTKKRSYFFQKFDIFISFECCFSFVEIDANCTILAALLLRFIASHSVFIFIE